jgi:hypothetical protein
MSRIALHTLLKDRRTFLAVGGAAAALLPISGIAFADTHHPRAVAAANRPRTREAVRTYKTSQTVAALRDVWIGHIGCSLMQLWSSASSFTADDLASGSHGKLSSRLIFLYTAWRGWEMVYKHRVAIADRQS